MIRTTLNQPVDLQKLMFMIDKEIVKHAQNHDIKDSILCVDVRQITNTIIPDNKCIELKEPEVKDAQR